MSKITISDLRINYGALEVISGVDLELNQGDLVCLLGRSGSGKTTLLRAIAGLIEPSGGTIKIGTSTFFDGAESVNVAPEKRGLGMVFQSYALWPHKTVMENITYGLKLRGIDKAERTRRAEKVLESVGLAGLADRYPDQLSGGQQQRVALVRSVVYEPPVILLDEPLSNLDANLREEARMWFRNILKEFGLTAIFVTHDQVEAMAISDQIVLLERGKIQQKGTPEELYNEPASVFVAEFMGTNNRLNVTIHSHASSRCEFEWNGTMFAGQAQARGKEPEDSIAVIRVEAVEIVEKDGLNCINATLDTSLYLGGVYEHAFKVGRDTIRARGPRLEIGQRYWLHLRQDHLWVF